MTAAKARGIAFGRPKNMRPDQQQVARELIRDEKSLSAVASTFNVHPATIYRAIEPQVALCPFSVPLSYTGQTREALVVRYVLAHQSP